MVSPFFTIVMPTRSRSGMLRTALKSILWQTCSDYECVLISDGSTDDTPKVLEEYSKKKGFQCHVLPPKGVPYCRNFAVTHSSGRFVTFLDDDDIWLPTRLEEFKKAAEARPEEGFWFSNAYVWQYDRILSRVFDPERPIPEGKVPGWYAVGETYLPYLSTNMSIRRDVFDKVGLFNEELTIMCDTDIVARALAAGFGAGALRKPLAIRRMHGLQVTRDYEKTQREGLTALKGGNPPPDVEKAYRRDLLFENAMYFVKSLQLDKARGLLERSDVPRDGRYRRMMLLTRLPRGFLHALRRLRALGVKAKSAFRPREFKEVEALVRPLITEG